MGARGNSGVILSQIWRGMAEGVIDKKTISGEDIASALQKAADVAYKGISNPVEGTILTVARDAAQAGQKSVEEGNSDPISVMEAVVEGASESVANTPMLLPVLKEAGVVDAHFDQEGSWRDQSRNVGGVEVFVDVGDDL